MTPPINIDGSQVTGITIDGQTVSEVTMDGDKVFGGAIPDSDVYLQDDWGDNKLTNRDESGTTTHNGVEGVYRPEWSVISGKSQPTVNNGQLTITGGDGIYADINLNLNETISWEWTNVDLSDGGTSSNEHSVMHCWSEQLPDETNGMLHEAYFVWVTNNDSCNLSKRDSSGNFKTVVSASPQSGTIDVMVTRSPSGDWELFFNGVSQGAGNDTEFTDPKYTAFIGNPGADHDYNEMKVF
jgi:hypothetical protein